MGVIEACSVDDIKLGKQRRLRTSDVLNIMLNQDVEEISVDTYMIKDAKYSCDLYASGDQRDD